MLKKFIVSVETDESLVGNSGGILTPEKRDGSPPIPETKDVQESVRPNTESLMLEEERSDN